MFVKIPELQDSIPVDAPPDWQDVAFDRLRLKVQTQAQQISQWSELHRKKEKPINNLNLETNQWAYSETAQSETVDQEDLLLAGKKGRIKGKGRGGKGPLPCANCGVSGHKAEQCTQPKKPWAERTCHTCGKTGHLSFQCQRRRKGANLVEEPGAEPTPVKHVMILGAVGERPKAATLGRVTPEQGRPRAATLGHAMSKQSTTRPR